MLPKVTLWSFLMTVTVIGGWFEWSRMAASVGGSPLCNDDLSNSVLGYLPAEHIETPTERLARLNKHRNIDVGHMSW